MTYVVIAWVLIAPAPADPRVLPPGAVGARCRRRSRGPSSSSIRARPLLTSLLLKLICRQFLLADRRLGRGASARLALAVLATVRGGRSAVRRTPASIRRWIPSTVAEPAWLQQIPRDMHERVYVGGRLEGYVNVFDIDAPKYAALPRRATRAMEQRYVLVGAADVPAVRARACAKSMSYDLPLLWPLDYARTVGLFKFALTRGAAALPDASRHALRRPADAAVSGRPAAGASHGCRAVQLYDFNPAARRVYIVPDALMGPDVMWQIEGMFQARFNPATRRPRQRAAAAAGRAPGAPVCPRPPTFVEDGLNRVVVRARTAGRRLSRADRHLHARLAGRRRRHAGAADARQRALPRGPSRAPGTHVVTFTYHPSMFYLGARITAATAAGARALVRAGPAAREAKARSVQRAPETREARHSPLAPFFVAFVGLLPVLGLFSLHSIFFVRDLSFFFWSRHLWLRHTLLSGQAPWWDPYVASGQSAIADALNQTLMPLTVAVRLLPSDVVSFNLWVALPMPIAALGMFVFLRRTLARRRRGPRRLRVRAVRARRVDAQRSEPVVVGRADAVGDGSAGDVRGARCEVRRHQCRDRIRAARAVWRAGDVGGHGGPGVLLRALDARR